MGSRWKLLASSAIALLMLILAAQTVAQRAPVRMVDDPAQAGGTLQVPATSVASESAGPTESTPELTDEARAQMAEAARQHKDVILRRRSDGKWEVDRVVDPTGWGESRTHRTSHDCVGRISLRPADSAGEHVQPNHSRKHEPRSNRSRLLFTFGLRTVTFRRMTSICTCGLRGRCRQKLGTT